MKYYPARLDKSYRTTAEALSSVGFGVQLVDRLISNATINQSESVLAVIGPGKAVVTSILPDGSVGLWQACIGLLSETQEKATEHAKEIDATLVVLKGSTWAVFEWREPECQSLH